MKKGFALMTSIMIISASLVLCALLVKVVYNCHVSVNAALDRQLAFSLAEAGLEKGKVELSHNPAWYTDQPYFRPDNAEWLIKYAIGQENSLGDGHFKVIREKGRDALYSVGCQGRGAVVLKLVFSNSPFETLAWQEL
ncbi:MAG: hypothetical protein JW782_05395 [Candidatus Saganbacteria bacterium]|nr:hypothetical protein [Candidatus Saganbacteria bacterium]